jgi:hypothetical protein
MLLLHACAACSICVDAPCCVFPPAALCRCPVLLPAGGEGTCPVRCRFLFQKALSASDAGVLGRMVMPRAGGELEQGV